MERRTAPKVVETGSEASRKNTTAPAEPEPKLQVDRVRLGWGGTLDGVLSDLGLTPEQRVSLLAELRKQKQLNLRRLPPQTGVAVVRDLRGGLAGVSCRAGAGGFVRLTYHAGSSWSSEKVEIPVRTSIETAGGIVEHSVAQALSSLRHGIYLTMAFADIFQWDIDLHVDPRPGDRVRLVYEVERMGELPEDLPPFGHTESREGKDLRIGRILAASYDGAVVRSSAYWVGEETGRGGYYDERGHPLQKTFLKSPLNYRSISSGFSQARRHPVTRKLVPHHGVDFAAPAGTPVVATADGRVLSASWRGPLGRTVKIRHGSGYQTVYGHLSRFAEGIRPGTEVGQNQVIGYVGATGRTTGPHLHYTLKHYGGPVDPMTFRNPPAKPLDPGKMPLLSRVQERWVPVLNSIRFEEWEMELAAGHPKKEGGSPGWGI